MRALVGLLLLAGCATTPAVVPSPRAEYPGDEDVFTSRTKRSQAVVRAFRRDHPCPETRLTKGACPGWVVDHAYPLCAGGADVPANMLWQEVRQSYIKDRIERELCSCKARLP